MIPKSEIKSPLRYSILAFLNILADEYNNRSDADRDMRQSLIISRILKQAKQIQTLEILGKPDVFEKHSYSCMPDRKRRARYYRKNVQYLKAKPVTVE